MFSTNRFTPEIAKALIASRKPYGIYNGCGATPAGARFFFGFYGYKTGAAQIVQWAYHFGNSVFQGDGLRQEDDGYVYLADDGPLPSVTWEAIRAGIDDYRYVSLLAQRIARARASGNTDTERAAGEADRALRGLLGRIGWRFQALGAADRTLPPNPSTLRQWRWQIVEQILKLQPLVGAAVRGERAPARVSPLELPWAKLSKEELQYGRQLHHHTQVPRRMGARAGDGMDQRPQPSRGTADVVGLVRVSWAVRGGADMRAFHELRLLPDCQASLYSRRLAATRGRPVIRERPCPACPGREEDWQLHVDAR